MEFLVSWATTRTGTVKVEADTETEAIGIANKEIKEENLPYDWTVNIYAEEIKEDE